MGVSRAGVSTAVVSVDDVLTVVAVAAFGDEGVGAGTDAAGCAAGVAGWAALDDLLSEDFAAGVTDEAFFAVELGELEETATACAVEDVPATDVEAGALGEDVFGAAAIVLFTGAEVFTATALTLLGCADGELLGEGAAAGATATVETTLTLETVTGLGTGSETAELGRAGTGVTTATAGAGLSAGFFARRAANCWSVACC